MPRLAADVASLLADVKVRLDRLVDAARAEGRIQALTEIHSFVGGGVPIKRGPGRPRKHGSIPAAKPRKARKNSWSGLSPAARLARINSIRKGKGLPPRSE